MMDLKPRNALKWLFLIMLIGSVVFVFIAVAGKGTLSVFRVPSQPINVTMPSQLPVVVDGGSGTAEDPYIIENRLFQAMVGQPTAIYICPTDYHVVIQNCEIIGLGNTVGAFQTGIMISNKNTIIRDNLIRACNRGINIGVQGDIVGTGIQVQRNVIDSCYEGLYFRVSPANTYINYNDMLTNQRAITFVYPLSSSLVISDNNLCGLQTPYIFFGPSAVGSNATWARNYYCNSQATTVKINDYNYDYTPSLNPVSWQKPEETQTTLDSPVVSLTENNVTVTLSWNVVPGAESYTIYRSLTYIDSTTLNQASLLASGYTGTSFSDNPPIGTTYYAVIAVAGSIESVVSNSPSVERLYVSQDDIEVVDQDIPDPVPLDPWILASVVIIIVSAMLFFIFAGRQRRRET